MASVALKHVSLYVNHPSDGSRSPQQMSSKNHLSSSVPQVFRRHITDKEKISPYESPAFSNYPGGSNILSLPKDIYTSAKTLYQSMCDRDLEEAQDAFTRLAGTPANLISAGGSIINYGVALEIIPITRFAPLIPVTYFFGIILCIIEGIVDCVSLSRTEEFRKGHDFKILSLLDSLLRDFDAQKSPEALKKFTAYLHNHPKMFFYLFGSEQTEKIQDLFSQILEEVKQSPLHYRKILKKYEAPLMEISRHLLLANYSLLQKEFLELVPKEVKSICEKTAKRFKNTDTPMEEQVKFLEEKCERMLNIKKKHLARRVRPWLVEELSIQTPALLKGLLESAPASTLEALKLSKEIHIQVHKKTLVHVLGVFALVIAAASIATLILCTSITIPYVLMALATVIAFARMVAYKTTLDSRGYQFDWKALLPDCFQSKKDEEKLEEARKELKRKDLHSLTLPCQLVRHRIELNPQAMRV